MSDKINLNKKKNDLTFLISIISIIGIILISIIGFSYFLFVRNIKVESAKIFEKAFEKYNEFNGLDNIYSKQEMEKEVIKALNIVIAKYPNSNAGKRALFYKGNVYFQTENFEKAEKSFQYFIDKYKKHYLLGKSYYFLSYCYSEQNKNNEAIDILKEFNEKNIDSYFSPLVLFRIASLYEIIKNSDEAIKYYSQIIDNYPESSQVLLAKKKKLLLENNIVL